MSNISIGISRGVSAIARIFESEKVDHEIFDNDINFSFPLVFAGIDIDYIAFQHELLKTIEEGDIPSFERVASEHQLDANFMPDLCLSAVTHYPIGVIRFLLDKDLDLNYQDRGGWSALHNAARRGDVEIVRLLIDKKAKIDLLTRGGTPLNSAAEKGHVEALQFLLEQGANANAQDSFERTPLSLAAKKNHKAGHHWILLPARYLIWNCF